MTRPERWAARINELVGTSADTAGGLAMPVGTDRLIIGQADGVVRCLELATGETVWTGSERHETVLQTVASSPDGRLIATSASDRMIRVWDAATGAVIARFAHPATSYDVRFSPDGERLAVACTDDTVGVYRLGSDQRIMTCEGHEAWPMSVDWSPRGDRIVSVGNDSTLRIWDATTGVELIRRELEGRSQAVAWSTTDQIAVGLEDGVIPLIDASGPLIEVVRLRPNADEIYSLQWAAGGQRLAVGAFEAVVVFDQRGGRQIARFDVDTLAHRIAWSPDATIVGASLCGDRVRLWDVPA